jgi:hypothetical protein
MQHNLTFSTHHHTQRGLEMPQHHHRNRLPLGHGNLREHLLGGYIPRQVLQERIRRDQPSQAALRDLAQILVAQTIQFLLQILLLFVHPHRK